MTKTSPLRVGDKVRSTLRNWEPDEAGAGVRYTVIKANHGWVTVRVADDPLNADLVYGPYRASLYARL
jgi:hypothetical protein